jgi:hypothetical protein
MSIQDHNLYIYSLLARFHAGLPLPEPSAFAKALGQLAFDYTPGAIARVDRLLRQIRQKLAPRPEAFLVEPKNQVFLHVLAFMLGETVARYRGARARWFNYDEYKILVVERSIPQIFPERFSTAIVCDIEGEGLLFPLGALCSALFDNPPGRVVEAADRFMRRAVGVPVLSAPGPDAVARAAEDDPAWQLGLTLGNLARLCIEVHLATGDSFPPQLLEQQADGKVLMTSLMYDANEGIETARYRMAHPENGAVAQALAYDGFIGLPEFRSDALILEGICHLGATPLCATLALPYWSAKDRKLVLHDFRLMECSLDDAGVREQLRAGLFSRMAAAGKPGPFTTESADELSGGLWRTYYVSEQDKDHLTARRTALPPLPWEAILAADEARELEAIRQKAGVVFATDFDPADWQSEAPDAEAEAQRLEKIESLGVVAKDPLNASIRNFPTLLRTGRVVWGALIQANGKLFKSGIDNLPAEVVYSLDGSTLILRPVAQALFALRQQLPPQADDALRKCADYLNAETKRVFGLPVPATLAPAPGLPDQLPGSLRISTLWVLRKHLPHGYLAPDLLPLLISDACPGHVMIVPCKAWPTALRLQWDNDRWQRLWQDLAAGECEKDARRFAEAVKVLSDYVERGEDIAKFREQARTGYALFAHDTKPPPMEWEWGRCDWLASYAELLLRKVENQRAQGKPLAHGLARQAFAAHATAMMIRMHRLMLERLRGKSRMRMPIEPDDIQYVALGLLIGAETHALTLARLLIVLWRAPDNYANFLCPEVWFIFQLLARHLNLELPEQTPFTRRPCLDALLAQDAWKGEAARIKPLLEAACVEHTGRAPQGPFLGLPIALALILRLRELAGLPNPAIEHDLLRVELGAPPAMPVSSDLSAALDFLSSPLGQRVRQRMRRTGYDEEIIIEAVLNDQPPKTEFALAPDLSSEETPGGDEPKRGKWLKWLRRSE